MGFHTHQNQAVGVGQEVPVVHPLLVLPAAAAAAVGAGVAAEHQPREETGPAGTPGHSSASAPLEPAPNAADVMPLETNCSGTTNQGRMRLPTTRSFPHTYMT